MRVANALLNNAEEVAFRELQTIADENALRLFAKPRLSDVIVKDGTHLEQRVFDFYTRAHVDFVIANAESKPLVVVEYDGPFHAGAVQRERDKMKDNLCVDAGLGILRINANHVTRRYRGISVLRWIIEVSELEKWFYKAQTEGCVPWDEPFDAAMIMTDGSGRKWPYWLSVAATQSINAFIDATDSANRKGWQGMIGEDSEKNLHELSFLWFGDKIIWAKTAIRRQNFEFPAYDLLREITTCELHLRLTKFRCGEAHAITAAQFLPLLKQFCIKYNAYPSHSHTWGTSPFSFSWSHTVGWRFAGVT